MLDRQSFTQIYKYGMDGDIPSREVKLVENIWKADESDTVTRTRSQDKHAMLITLKEKA